MSKTKLRLQFTPRQRILGWIWFLFQLLVLPVGLQILNLRLSAPLSDAVINFIFFSLNFLMVFLIFRTFLLKSLEAAGKKFWNFLQAAVLGYVACRVCGYLLNFGIALLFPDFFNVNDANISVLAGSNYWLITAGTVLLVPTAEECFYRGLLFADIRNRNRALGYILSTVAFSAIHVVSYLGSADGLTLALCFVQYLPTGVWLAWSYEKADSIYAPIVIHTVINALGMLAMR